MPFEVHADSMQLGKTLRLLTGKFASLRNWLLDGIYATLFKLSPTYIVRQAVRKKHMLSRQRTPTSR